MKETRCAAVVVVLAIALGASISGAGAQARRQGGPKATEVGVTGSTIRIAVVADVENAPAPGLFAGTANAVKGFGKYINSHGGLAGRKVAVDFIDSHLNNNEARNAVIRACSQDFALVGTAALFLDNVDDMVACKDQAGAATGIPDLATIVTATVQQCSPVTFPINPPQLDCSTKDQTPQTYRANRGSVTYYRRTHKKLHGVSVYSNDVKTAEIGALAVVRGQEAGGVKNDGEIGVSALASQTAFTPIAQRIKNDQSNYALNIGPYNTMVLLRKEAKLQGIDPKGIVWDCFSNCYDKRLIQQGGADVEGTYVTLAQLPFSEAKNNKALANYVKSTGKDKVDGFGAYAWIASLLFRDVVNKVVKTNGKDGLTRKNFFAALKTFTAFNADGMYATTDIAQRIPSPCFMMTQVKNGQFTRVYPAKPGTFDCKKSNAITVKTDLLH